MRLLTNFKFWRQATGHSIKVKLGRFQPPRGKSILICIEGPPSDWIDNFMRNFRESNPRENVFILDGAIPTLPLAGGDSLPYPIPLFGVTRRFLRRLRARVILVDKGVTPPGKFLSSALVNDVSIAYLEIPPDRNHSGRTHAMSPGQSPSAKIVGGLMDCEGQESVAVIAPLLAREMEAYINLKKRMKFFLWERVTFRLYAKRLHKLISFAEVKASLGNPESILCLGNGPSSEDARLSKLEHDAIFRVNHRWLDRGLFTAADAIFTGALDSVLHFGKDALYIFIENERSMRIIRKAKKKIQRLSFTNAEDLGFPVEEFYPYQPTNGLIMIYVAVNLRPDKLIIAGIDLYRDPRGCYPGETSTPNVYTSGHDEDRELDLMLCLLASYQGNLTIIGDGLEFEYERYISENREPV